MIRSPRFIKAIYYLILLRIVTSVGSLMDLFFGIFPIPRAESTFNFTNVLLVIASVLGFFIIPRRLGGAWGFSKSGGIR